LAALRNTMGRDSFMRFSVILLTQS